MPYAAPRICATPGCPHTTTQGPRCDRCRRREQQRKQEERGTAHKRGYGARHRKWRRAVLQRCNYICEDPFGIHGANTETATIADHIIPHQDGGPKYALSNGQGLCHACHNKKTADDVRKRGGR